MTELTLRHRLQVFLAAYEWLPGSLEYLIEKDWADENYLQVHTNILRSVIALRPEAERTAKESAFLSNFPRARMGQFAQED